MFYREIFYSKTKKDLKEKLENQWRSRHKNKIIPLCGSSGRRIIEKEKCEKLIC